jgi:hypothetical protein
MRMDLIETTLDTCFYCCTYHVLREHMSEHLRLLVRSFLVSLHVQLWKRGLGLIIVEPKEYKISFYL